MAQWNPDGGVNGGRRHQCLAHVLMDIRTSPCRRRLRIFRHPHVVLPTIKSSSEICGYGRRTASSRRHANRGHSGRPAGHLWAGVFREERGQKNTYGTGCFMLMNTGTRPIFSDNGLHDGRLQDRRPAGRLRPRGSIAVAGSLVQWLRDNLGMIVKNLRTSGALRATVEDAAARRFVPAFSEYLRPSGVPARAA